MGSPPAPALAASGCGVSRSAGLASPPLHEDAMLNEERDLAEDAQWKRIQQNTFTRWANEHLKPRNRRITSLETDLQDGLNLIALIEELSGKRMPRHSRQPAFRSQKLENVSVALRFLERDEHIKIVNIGEYRPTEGRPAGGSRALMWPRGVRTPREYVFISDESIRRVPGG